MMKAKGRPTKLALLVMACTATNAAAAKTDPSGQPQGNGQVRAAPALQRGSHAALKRTFRAEDLRVSFKNRIEVKFREGSGVRARGGELALEAAKTVGPSSLAEVDRVRATLRTVRRSVAMKMHPFTEEAAEQLKARGERDSGELLPDPNLWFYVYLDAGSDQEVVDVVNALNALDVVEVAYPSPLPVPSADMNRANAEAFQAYWREHARMDLPALERVRAWERGEGAQALVAEALPTPKAEAAPAAPGGTNTLAVSYVAEQDYGEAAPIGIDTDWLRTQYWNAYGNSWGFTDAEYSWNYTHQDLTQLTGAVLVNGQPHASAAVLGNRNHGTAVLGVLASNANAFGTTGLVHAASVRLSTEWPSTGYDRASAIYSASNQFWNGAVILLEMQAYSSIDCNGDGVVNTGDLVPSEYVPAIRDAIKVATGNGRIVVEAAGNGNCNLDAAGFAGYFSATDATKDSGAIIVGAGEKLTRNKASFSTYGSRVDTHAEGDWKIVTTGYGDKYSAEGENLFYAAGFSGTSGASPIVTSAAVALSGVMYLRHGSYYAPKELRDVLRRDGTAQVSGGKIGPRPDLRKQVSHMQNRYTNMHSTDFDGDGRSDYAVWRPSTGMWNIVFSATHLTQSIQWGQQGDVPVPADVTGDARAELIVWRPSTGTWHVRNWDGTTQSTQWGTLGDIPVPLDFTGDKKAEFAVYRPTYVGGTAESQWHIRYANGTSTSINWGAISDVPIARDFDGDGYEDLSVYRPSTGQWIIRFLNGTNAIHALGAWGEVPVPFKAGNQWNLGLWRPNDGTFTTKNIHGGGTASTVYGIPGDVPRFGDTNGDGTDEYIVWRPSSGYWYNAQFGALQWGLPGDIALSR
ncbi:hypothetical protein D7V97_40340 [Corallococcus sp. CA053C]|uniref:S8 family serine peptidase n=1 Tax=Corallococcus sp. CA053C TaxID=2316732 RepID=UPI000EA2F2FB|nr:S8 family serine peptidase [Corallococcus sp. CA053C]RKG93049.1 hypothetical protein D7V97_40340 [Corallococcus sp. CA053C]